MRRLAKCGIHNLGVVLVLGCIGYSGHITQDKTVTVDQADSQVDLLVATHGCWSGAAPDDMAGVTPGHVVATKRSGEVVYSVDLVEPALEQIFDGINHNLKVHAFCR